MQKSEKYLERIVEAKNKEEAIDLLREIADDLGIGQSYGMLVYIKERLGLHKAAYNQLKEQLKAEAVPDVKFLQNLRMEAIHCYQTLVDELGAEINRLKINYGDDRKSEVRGTILTELMHDEEFKAENKAKSVSALKEIYSVHNSYKEWLSCSAMSYGLWNDYRDTLKYINMFIDSVAAMTRTEQNAQRMDLT